MKAIIVVEEHKSMYPLTIDKPLSLLVIAGKTIIEHNLEALQGVHEVCIVGSHHSIKSFLGEHYGDITLSYTEMKQEGDLVLQDNILYSFEDGKLSELLTLTYPWDLLEANELLLSSISKDIQGDVEDGATIKGEVIIGKGTLVRSGSYIEGPVYIGSDCEIGPNCYIRAKTSIGNNCHVGNAVEIKNCILGNNTNVAHLSYVGDSVLGDHVNFGASTITANLRHDEATIKSPVNGEMIDTKRVKFGVIVGDQVHTGIHTSLYPGRKIWPGKSTMPNEVVTKDIK